MTTIPDQLNNAHKVANMNQDHQLKGFWKKSQIHKATKSKTKIKLAQQHDWVLSFEPTVERQCKTVDKKSVSKNKGLARYFYTSILSINPSKTLYR